MRCSPFIFLCCFVFILAFPLCAEGNSSVFISNNENQTSPNEKSGNRHNSFLIGNHQSFKVRKFPNVDSIVTAVIENARVYSLHTPDYEANLFIKASIDVLERGPLLKLIPYLKRIDDGKDNYYAEFIGALTFTNPNIYNQNLYSISTNKKNFVEDHIETIVSPNIRLNVYSQFLYGNLYSPLAYKAQKFYSYSIDSLWTKGNDIYYRISFKPYINNYKFINGYFTVRATNWSLRDMFIKGNIEFAEYTNHIEMGEEGAPDEFLPVRIHISTDAGILSTKLKGDYMSVIKYTSIKKSHLTKNREEYEPQNYYDLSLQYRTSVDTLSAIAKKIVRYRDSIELANLPKVEKDTLLKEKRPSAVEKMGRFIAKDYSFDFKDYGKLSITPLVSPILLDFSSSKGITYTHRLRYSKVTTKDKFYYIEPSIGYSFKYKELYWGVKGELNYNPSKMNRMFMDIGNGNTITTDRIRDELFALPEHVYDSTSLNLRQFSSIQAKFGHKIELANGLTLATNISLLNYSETDKSDLTPVNPQSEYLEQAKQIASNNYRIFVPEIELQYTPGQYYYMNGKRKVYLYSKYPTFTLNFAHALKGVFGSTTRYNKVEFDMQQKLQVGPMHYLHYRAGAGLFYDYTNLFFTEFANLRHNNLAQGWDDIGGDFQLLTPLKYNAIDKYIRGNVQYDAPLLLVPTLLRNVKFVTKERLYCNVLLVDTMNPYIELGYGIGTNIFNVGVFWGGEINKMDMFGAKFTFEVFNN